ncbi:hypothetical protein [Henriciella marina]|uniref:hypothetical protein n=1 Tax=Henriciella marina TaxID=453851 RepID=UPI000370C45B|nr:hypothetical protein [Henriciella marina]
MLRAGLAIAILVGCFRHEGAAQVSVIELADITFPVDAELKGIEGCCKIAFELQSDASKRIDEVSCTSPVFEQSAVDVVLRSRISGLPQSKARIPIKFAFSGSTSGSCTATETWNEFVGDAAAAFPWEVADFDSDHDHQIARAKGIAALRVNLDYAGSCGAEPYLQPDDARELHAIDSLATLRVAESTLLHRQSWLDCRKQTLNNYETEAAETAARYAQLTSTDFRYWVAQYMSSQVRRTREELNRDATELGQFEVALNTAMSRAENIARLRAERRRRTRQDRQRDRSKADAFFASRGPGQYETCLEMSYTYSAQQACLNDWIGGSAGRVPQPILHREAHESANPVVREASSAIRASEPVPAEPWCPQGYSCNCGPEPVPFYPGGSCR